MKVVDLIGQRFGRLTVVGRVQGRESRRIYWACECDCGGIARPRTDSLKRGLSQSCGCIGKEGAWKTKGRHKMSLTPEYHTWQGIKDRCSNPSGAGFEHYGGRGIQVCEQWRRFENFFADMGFRPSTAHSIDRKDNDGDYCKENCRWATRAVQSRNTSRNVMVTFMGEVMCLTDWAMRQGIKLPTVVSRMRRGWTLEQSLGLEARP